LNIDEDLALLITLIEKPVKKFADVNYIVDNLEKINHLIDLLKTLTFNYIDLLTLLASKIKIENTSSNKLLYRFGDKPDKFYLIFKGKVSSLLPKEMKMDLSEDDYIHYLVNLKNNNENELVNLLTNKCPFSLKDRVFEHWLKNSGSLNQKASKQLTQYLEDINIKPSLFKKLDPSVSSVDKYIEFTKPERDSDSYKKRDISVYIYQETKLLKEGDIFGDFSSSNLAQKR
jgi:hypothetical protein